MHTQEKVATLAQCSSIARAARAVEPPISLAVSYIAISKDYDTEHGRTLSIQAL